METGIHRLLSDLARQDFWSRRTGISDLTKRPEKEYVGCLEECIRNHEDADLRNTAMEIYTALRGRAYPSLRSLLKDEDHEVRLFAVNVLHQMRDEGSLPLLLESLRDPDLNVRTASAEALGGLGDEAAIPALRASLEDEPWVVMAAIHAIGEIGGEEGRALLSQCLGREGCAEMSITALKRAGNRDSIRHLTKCFEFDELAELALDAIVTISEREGVRPQPEYFLSLVPQLLRIFESQKGEMRRHAFTALCWSEDIRGLSCLIDAVRDDELQEQAIEGLILIGRKAVCSITDELKGTAGGHRAMLAKVLSMIGENMALLQFWEDEDPEVRVEVALAIRSLDMERARQALICMRKDPCEEVRQAAGGSPLENGIKGACSL
ncbi:MAG: HEAT repeat domain-containing protein [Nitrospirae bacterium]|nr:HEAT repeat domain-containing protein [Nitrospirota bacterium]